MFKFLYDSFVSLDYIEKSLLIILILSILFKGIGEIICWIICKNFNKDKTYSKPCIYLKRGKKHDCELQTFKNKYFILTSEECDKENCPGYRTSNYSIEEIKSLKKIPFAILTTCKWIADLSSILLIIKTLFNTTIS